MKSTLHLALGMSAFACVAMAAAQYPSYDMALVLDRGTGSVHRFDSQTGTHLGQIGQGFIGEAMSMAYDRSDNTVYVQHRAVNSFGFEEVNFTSFNAFTGAFRASATATLLGLPGEASTTPLFTGVVGTAASNVPNTAMIARRSGDFVVFHEMVTTGSFMNLSSGIFFDDSGLPQGNQLGLAAFRNSSPTGLSGAEAFATVGGSVYRRLPTSSWSLMYNAPITQMSFIGNSTGASRCSSGNFVSNCTNLGSGFEFPAYDDILAFGRGHSLTYTLGIGVDGQARVDRYALGSLDTTYLGTFGQGYLVDPIALDIHAAPEPTTFAVMGLGAAALAWRRRRQASR